MASFFGTILREETTALSPGPRAVASSASRMSRMTSRPDPWRRAVDVLLSQSIARVASAHPSAPLPQGKRRASSSADDDIIDRLRASAQLCKQMSAAHVARVIGTTERRVLQAPTAAARLLLFHFVCWSAGYIRSSLAGLLLLPNKAYIDDFIMVDLARNGLSGQRGFASICSTIGYRLDVGKREEMAAAHRTLGVIVDVSKAHLVNGECFIRSAPDRVLETKSLISEIIADQFVHPSLAASLLGKLAFMASSMFGRVGRAANAPLRIAANDEGLDWAAVDRCLRFFLVLFDTVRPRTISMTSAPFGTFFRLYTDASESGIGVVILAGDRSRWSAAPLTPDVKQRYGMTNIGDYEGFASLCGLHLLAQLMPDVRYGVHYIDNTHVCSNHISGYSRQPSLVCMMLEYNLLVARDQMVPWFEYVPSASNIADVPSRFPHMTDLSSCVGSPFLKGVLGAANHRPFVFPIPSSLWTTLPAFSPTSGAGGE